MFKSMFKIFSVLALLVITAGIANADSNWGYNGNPAALAVVFSNASTTQTSTVINVTNYRTKTLFTQGIAVSGHTNTTLSGTVAALCGPTATGPFTACSGLVTTSGGGSISTTSNAVQTWIDSSQFLEVTFTKTSGECSVWLSLGN